MALPLQLVVLVALVPVIMAIQCYNGNQGVYVSNPKSLPTVDCGAAINTCAKTVDLTAQMAYRTCGSSYTCTYVNGTSSPRGFCYNVSTAQTQCCCYGNLCNAATRTSFNVLYIILPLLAVLAFQTQKLVL
ncbi:unnamed protein product [Bursaphelenchus okinawaensis]|uniref:UPAR/Ly6 domain-containing protein n=1 Tax=Bursaphelenchus okinawaensis TaxID=465554 RepID=A0A811L5F2_9BILA|nr:unnamed protein product [Bursaphelenchus okinawaensis]CAG9117036.1 unnamed protein product [Bursaphelenchus okinawaensis]